MSGMRVMEGGYMLARITLTDDYCLNPESIISVIIDPATTETPDPKSLDKSFFRVYPNPTTGRFTLELSSEELKGTIEIEAYDLIGKVILKIELPALHSYDFDFSHLQPGIYIFKVVHGSETGFVKLVRQ